MQALVFTDSAEFRLEDRPVPEATAGRVLLKVELCGICGTDLHAPVLGDVFRPNVIIGHEFVAQVVESGPGVTGFEPGQRVVINPTANACGTCEACLRDVPNQCRVGLITSCCGLGKDGGMAEYVAVEAVHVHPLSDDLTAEVGAWTEPVAVAVRGVEQARLRLGASVAVLGAGPIGQLALQVARAAGAGETLVVESSRFRRDTALACGADVAIGPDQLDQADRLYDVVIDCTGAPPAFDGALELVGHNGRVVVVGSHTGPITMSSPSVAQIKEATIVFSAGYRDRREFRTAVSLLERGLVNVAALTSGVLPINRHAEAFAALRDPESAIKVLLDPTKAA
jgi:2-desacetyl-2-hydroxyethyl bacteriochlorophyllide A dehydrogenase